MLLESILGWRARVMMTTTTTTTTTTRQLVAVAVDDERADTACCCYPGHALLNYRCCCCPMSRCRCRLPRRVGTTENHRRIRTPWSGQFNAYEYEYLARAPNWLNLPPHRIKNRSKFPPNHTPGSSDPY